MLIAHQPAAASILESVLALLSHRSVMVVVGLGMLSQMIPRRRLSLAALQRT
jgi:hypothetical protein